MNQRPLGRTGITVSEIGFGTWGIGGHRPGGPAGYGPTDDRESLRALRRALELGITLYDAADLYGAGHSEELLGEAFASERDRVVIVSKAGFVAGGPGRQLGDLAGQDFSPAYVRAALEGTLRRLRSDYVDVYLMHAPPPEVLEAPSETLAVFEALRREGKVRAIGLSSRSPKDAVDAVERHGLAVVEVNFNAADQRAIADGLFAVAERAGTGVLARTPLAFGFLSGTLESDQEFPEGDHRRRWSPEQRAAWIEAGRKVEALLAASGPRGRRADGQRGPRADDQSRAQLALRYCLSYPEVAAAIPGMLTAAEVEENARASALGPLSSDERCELEELYRALPDLMPRRG